MEGLDNRRNRRISVEGVTGSVMFAYDIDVRNVSPEGVALRTTKRLQLNKVYLLKIPCGDTHVPIRGEVVWCALTGSQKTADGGMAPVYSMGIRFVPGQQDRLVVLKTFFDHLEREDGFFRAMQIGITRAPGTDNELTLPGLYPVIRLSPRDVTAELDMATSLGVHLLVEIHLEGNGTISALGTTVAAEETAEERFRTVVEFTRISRDDRMKIRQILSAIHAE